MGETAEEACRRRIGTHRRQIGISAAEGTATATAQAEAAGAGVVDGGRGLVTLTCTAARRVTMGGGGRQ